MDRLKSAARSTRDRTPLARPAPTPASATLSVPHANLPAADDSSTNAVNNGLLGPQPGTAVHDYALPAESTLEPPTSLQSSVDAEKPLPDTPATSSTRRTQGSGSGSGSGTTSGSGQDPTRLTVPTAVRRPGNASPQARRPAMGTCQPSIGIRRMSDTRDLRSEGQQANPAIATANAPLSIATSRLPALTEEVSADGSLQTVETAPTEPTGRLRRASNALRDRLGLQKTTSRDDIPAFGNLPPEYDANMVDLLDTLDPEVQTLTSLTNVQNSLFVPNLGRWVNRRPTYVIRSSDSEAASSEGAETLTAAQPPSIPEEPEPTRPGGLERAETQATLTTIDSRLSESRYAVLPHGTSLDGWTKEDKQKLNDHVRHMLHSRLSRFRRALRGFGQYVRRPLGFFVTLYATLITLFGLAWVLFLIGWVDVGGRQIYIINVIDEVLVALFAVVGDGLAPFRAVDTYHMIYIAHYHHFTWMRRQKERLPELHDHNDLPSNNAPITAPSDDPEKQWEFTLLTPAQQAKLEHHQNKFCKSHSFYKPHETETHFAFPLRLLVAIVVLLDCHSLFQIALGACTWSIYYKRRPAALTTVILCCSIACNAVAGLLILVGDRKTRKKDVLEKMNRQELTSEAIGKIEREKEKENDRDETESRNASTSAAAANGAPAR